MSSEGSQQEATPSSSELTIEPASAPQDPGSSLASGSELAPEPASAPADPGGGLALRGETAPAAPVDFIPTADLPPRTITPASSVKPAFPRKTAIAAGAAAVAGLLAALIGVDAIHGFAMAVALVAVCRLAGWLEQRVYYFLLGRGRAARVALSMLVPPAALVVGIPLAFLFGLITNALGDEGLLLASLLGGALWLGAAAVGSAVIVLLDVVISALLPGFRARVQAAVLGLLSLGVLSAVAIYAGARFAAGKLHTAESFSVDLGGYEGDLRPEDVRAFLERPGTADLIAGGILLAVTVLALPVILSATGKLADAVMERLNPLRQAFDEVTEGRLDVSVEEGGSRELATISNGFNRMTGSLRETLRDLDQRHRELAEMNRASSRFVPFQFLELLRKSTIREIARGDQIELEISVLFSDIRGFTTMAEGMGPQATFGFINRYLGHMEAEIHREDGFINDIFGDGIMALFHRGADAAMRAALGMLAGVERFNERLVAEGQPPIRVGIGMNSGPLMLGTIGGQDRLSCTVVGDPANAAARVEGMTKLYKARLLITDKTRERLADPSCYQLREVDRVQAKGKHEPLVIYEVLDGELGALGRAKWASRDTFAAALEEYRKGDFAPAQERFESCLSGAPDDGAAQLYVERCAEHRKQGVTDWDGLTRLTSK